jgi:antibiotic biosynthesis monooxygenase (ABM) superfamily enzyme
MKTRTARFEGVLRVRPDKTAEFATWQAHYLEKLSEFPGQPATDGELTSMKAGQWSTHLRFDTAVHLQDWLKSDERAQLMAEVDSLSVGPMICRLSVGDDTTVGVTEVIFSKVRPGSEGAYRDWQAETNRRQAEFSGYLGAALQPPVAGQDHWTTLLRFDTASSLEKWLDSDARREMLQKEEELVESRQQHRLASAFPGWIPEPPAESKPPPEWKISMLIVLGLFPIVMLQMRFLNPLLGDMPLAPATLIGNIIGTGLITYLTMPLSIRSFQWWVYEKEDTPGWWSAAGAVLMFFLYALEVLACWNLVPN